MTVSTVLLLLFFSGVYFIWARGRAVNVQVRGGVLHSTPSYHGYYAVFVGAGPALIAWLVSSWSGFPDWAILVVTALGGGSGIWLARVRDTASFRARNRVERVAEYLMAAVSFLAVVTTFSIFIALVAESIRFFTKVPVTDFLFGLQWSPQTAIRQGQVGATGAFGAIPLLTGTLLVTVVAMLTAVPLGILSAVYLSEYASKRVHAVAKPVLELLAGVPTVVYGFFALLIVGPAVADAASYVSGLLGQSYHPPAQNALSAGLVMGVMIIPFVSSLSDDVISSIPKSLEEGALAVGARKSETIIDVILPAAAPGLVGAFLLAVSRAIGETMIVVMAASRSANLTGNPLERVTTITVQIVALLTGDQEFDSPKTLSAFALGLVLFLTTLAINIVALMVVKRYRTRYD